MKYRIKRVYYPDGDKAPWWKIMIYKNGLPYGESAQYSSLFYTIKLWFLATIRYIV